MRITKKEVSDYINQTQTLYPTLEDFKTDLVLFLEDLNKFPKENSIQIKFFDKVLDEVNLRSK
jgi:hypothetical protein